MRLRLLPQQWIGLALCIALAVATLACWQATHLPALSVGVELRDAQLHLKTAKDDPALSAMDVLIADSGDALRLTPEHLVPEPDMAFASYRAMDRFFAGQEALSRLLEPGRALDIRLQDGTTQSVTVRPGRTLLDLPFLFWFQLFCGVFGFVAGISVWVFRPDDPATRYYALTGLGMLMFATAAAVYSTRELVLPGALFATLSAINQSGALLFCAGLLAVLWYYPTRLSSFPAGPVIVAIYLLCGLGIFLRVTDSVSLIAHLPILLGYGATYVLAAVQWRRTRGNPYDRAALQAFLLAWLFGSGAFVAVMMLPAMMGFDNGALQGYAFGFFLLIYLGVAVGVMRYQLFRLDRWWFTTWAVTLGGLAVILLDGFFVYVLSLDFRLSTITALAFVGWVYFPIRQWVWRRLTRYSHQGHSKGLITMVTDVLSKREQSEQEAWEALLERVFSPRLMAVDRLAHEDAIADGGQRLRVGPTGHVGGFELAHCWGGTRLFEARDLHMLSDLRELFGEILGYRGLLEEGAARERDRVASDLHDDVGARLLTLAHRLEPGAADYVRAALAELRSVVHSMRAAPVSFDELLGDWRAEVAERCEASGAALAWDVEGEVPDSVVDGGQALALTRVMRESVTNALKHAQPDRLRVELEFFPGKFRGRLSHAYEGEPPENWSDSLGLHNLRNRLAKLEGGIEWIQEGHLLETRWHVPLADNA